MNWENTEDAAQAALEDITGIHLQRNHPKVVVTKFPKAIVTGKAGPDYTIIIGGIAVQLEIKSRTAKNRYTMDISPDIERPARTRAQFLRLLDAYYNGARAGYLFWWRNENLGDFGGEWRLHDLAIPDGDKPTRRVVFVREEGELVRSEYAGGLILPRVTKPQLLGLACLTKQGGR